MTGKDLGVPRFVSASPRLVFAIPLKPQAACADWNKAQENLRRTVHAALVASTGFPAEVWVACHEEPDLKEFRAAVHLCPAPFSVPQDPFAGGRDKARKRRLIGACLREYVADDVTVVFLDADDLVHRDLVRYVLTDDGGSYLIDQGYIYDSRARVLERYPSNFHRRCGSSFVFRFAARELPTSFEDVDAPFSVFGTSPEQRGHQDYDLAAVELGRPPAPVPFPACVYLVNHPESLWTAQTGGHLRINRRPFDIMRAEEARRILRDDFSSSEMADAVAGDLGVATAVARASFTAGRRRVMRRFGIEPTSVIPIEPAPTAERVPEKR